MTVPIYLASSILYVDSNMQEMGSRFAIARTEVSIAAFALVAEGRDFVSQAERGGEVYAFCWEQKPDWTWRRPFSVESDKRFPAVHLAYSEAEAFCK